MGQSIKIVGLSVILLLSACNSNEVVDTGDSKEEKKVVEVTEKISEKPTIKTSEPIPQAGGYSNISNDKLKELKEQGVLLVDIRREEEWKQTGIIEGSKTITFFDKTGNVSSDFIPKLSAVAKLDQPIMLICRTGNRTKAASEALVKHLGYKDVMNVTHGITHWISEKRPVVTY